MNVKDLIDYVDQHRSFLAHNAQALDIYEGNLGHYVVEIMRKTLSKSYFETIQDRIIPINVLTRLIEKMSKVYAYPVTRTSDTNQEFVDNISKMTRLDQQMLLAEEFSFLFKGYALEPYIDKATPQLRVIPYDRFIPLSEDKKNPQKMTGMIKMMGKVEHQGSECELFHYWTDEIFMAYTEKGIYDPDMYVDGKAIEGNPIGVIPFVYGNRSKSMLVPKADSDMLQLTKMIPIVLSDLGGSVMYQCFTILFGIDVKTANLTMSPNAFWDIKSDPKSEKTPQVGTIKPEADVNKVLDYVKNIFTLWLETKGLKVGNVGTMDGNNSASGISKIIDEMDTAEIRRASSQRLGEEEQDLWNLMAKMNNYWIESVPEYRAPKIDADFFEVSIEYTQPEPMLSRKEIFETTKAEYEAGFLTAEAAIERMYPDLEGEAFEARVDNLRSLRVGREESNRQQQSETGSQGEQPLLSE